MPRVKLASFTFRYSLLPKIVFDNNGRNSQTYKLHTNDCIVIANDGIAMKRLVRGRNDGEDEN